MDETKRGWGRNIRQCRRTLGPDGRPRAFAAEDPGPMSQARLAELVGVQQSAVAKWERGLAEPRTAHKQMLAAVLHQDVFMLFPLNRSERAAS